MISTGVMIAAWQAWVAAAESDEVTVWVAKWHHRRHATLGVSDLTHTIAAVTVP